MIMDYNDLMFGSLDYCGWLWLVKVKKSYLIFWFAISWTGSGADPALGQPRPWP